MRGGGVRCERCEEWDEKERGTEMESKHRYSYDRYKTGARKREPSHLRNVLDDGDTELDVRECVQNSQPGDERLVDAREDDQRGQHECTEK